MLEKTKIYRPGFLKSRFHTTINNELSSKPYQKLKDFPNNIVISFSAKKSPSYRNGNQKCNWVLWNIVVTWGQVIMAQSGKM